jgi:predicted branched-subunit amino acid permease
VFVGRLLPGLSQARNRAQFLSGLRDAGPPLLATGIWALVTGIATVKSGLLEWLSVFMTVTLFAGSAQLMALPLLKEMAPLWLIFAAGLVVNIRFLIFSAALQPFFRHYSWPRRMALGYFTTDVGFVLFMKRYGTSSRRADPRHAWYFLGVVGPGWVVWNSCAIVGIYLAGIIPTAWSLEFAAVLALLSVVIPWLLRVR